MSVEPSECERRNPRAEIRISNSTGDGLVQLQFRVANFARCTLHLGPRISALSLRISAFGFRIWPTIAFALALTLGAFNELRAADTKVIVYTSQDQVYAEPILKKFEQQSGIKVAAVYDSEAVKTVGLANRLLAERHHPQCDVFWSNEELRTRQLAVEGVFRPTRPWGAVGYRSRRIIINTNLLSLAAAPHSLTELTNRAWQGRVALAYPLFGTTATHFLALRQAWGVERWESWCRALAANKPFLVDGNSVAAKMVARGEAWIGLTDSDDVAAEQREGAPLAVLPIDSETLLIPNTVAVTRNAPHDQAAEKLWSYLQGTAVTRQLIDAHALEGFQRAEVSVQTLQPDWDKLLLELRPATLRLKEIFLR